jgi:hypothetical protein
MANSRPALWETLQLVVIFFYSPRLQPFTTMTGWWLSLPLWKIWLRQLFTLFPTEWKVIKAIFQTTNRIFISTSSSKKSVQSPNLPFIRISLPQIAWKVQKSLPSSPPLEGAFHGCLTPFTAAVGSNWDAHLKLVLFAGHEFEWKTYAFSAFSLWTCFYLNEPLGVPSANLT